MIYTTYFSYRRDRQLLFQPDSLGYTVQCEENPGLINRIGLHDKLIM